MKFQTKHLKPKDIPAGSMLVYFNSSDYSYQDIVNLTAQMGDEFTLNDLIINNIYCYKTVIKPYILEDDLLEVEVEWLNIHPLYDEDDIFINFDSEAKQRLLIVPSELDLKFIDFKLILKLLAGVIGLSLILSIVGQK